MIEEIGNKIEELGKHLWLEKASVFFDKNVPFPADIVRLKFEPETDIINALIKDIDELPHDNQDKVRFDFLGGYLFFNSAGSAIKWVYTDKETIQTFYTFRDFYDAFYASYMANDTITLYHKKEE